MPATSGTLGSAKSSASLDLADLRWQLPAQSWWCLAHRFTTSGPEAMQLREEESYGLILSEGVGTTGIQVVSHQPAGSTVSWEVSGAVVFAGEAFRALSGIAKVCETSTEAREVDVGVIDEDAKPLATARPLHVLLADAVHAAQFVLFFLCMGAFELDLGPGVTPWWRMTFCCLTSAVSFFSVAREFIGRMMGATLGVCTAAVLACFAAVGQSCIPLMPIGWIGGRLRRWNAHAASLLIFTGYSIVVMTLITVQRACCAADKQQKIRWRAHVGWLLWMLLSTFGSIQLLYAVALFYSNLSRTAAGVSAVALPILTSVIEQLAVIGTVQGYKWLVWGTRRKKWDPVFLGDQRLLLIGPISLTHSFSEATRLASILAPIVRSPSLDWIPPLLTSFGFNIFMRSYHWSSLLSCLLPARCGWLLAPDVGTLLHNEARFCFGYQRFVPILALGSANLVLSGFSEWPVYNLQATLLVVVALVLEAVEDAVVASGLLTRASWKTRLAHTHRGVHPLHLTSVIGFDRDGAVLAGPSVNVSGVRSVSFGVVICMTQPACGFTYNLVALMLGAGFVHRACPAAMQHGSGPVDGIFWSSPLQC